MDNVPTHGISSQRHAENVLNLTKIQVCKTVKALMAAFFSLNRAEKYKTEEEKRPGGKKTHSDLFGIEGSFRFAEKVYNVSFFSRKLDID